MLTLTGMHPIPAGLVMAATGRELSRVTVRLRDGPAFWTRSVAIQEITFTPSTTGAINSVPDIPDETFELTREPRAEPSTNASMRATPDPAWRWQVGKWDTRLRRSESYHDKWEYVRHNPVRKGLVTRAEDWPYQGMLNELRW